MSYYVRISGPEPLLDREPVQREVEHLRKPQLDLLSDLAMYGVLQLKRCFGASSRDIPDVVLILILFRQLLVALDALTELLAAGACYAARMPLRALFEVGWAIEWMLKYEPEASLRFYVAHLRRNRHAQKRLITGSPEYNELVTFVRSELPDVWSTPPAAEMVAEATAAVARIDAVLAHPRLQPIDDEFEAVAAKRKFEPAWYQVPAPGGKPHWYHSDASQSLSPPGRI